MKHQRITTPRTAACSLPDLARSIASGTSALLPRVDHELYDFPEWQEAAEYALDGDYTDLAYMLNREAAYQDFVAWQGVDYERRQYADFDTWLEDGRAWRDEPHGWAA